MLRAAGMLRQERVPPCLYLLQFPIFFSFSFGSWLSLSKISVKIVAEHKLKEQKIQRPHMTKNADLTRIV